MATSTQHRFPFEHRISTLQPSEFERLYRVKLTPVLDEEGLPIILFSDDVFLFLGKAASLGNFRGVNQLREQPISVDVREANTVLDYKRKEVSADLVVGVTYTGPYCRGFSNETLLAKGYAMRVQESSY